MIREGVTRDEWRTAYIKGDDNDSDILTKKLPIGEKRKRFVRNFVNHIFRFTTQASISAWGAK